jgi:hypothetical protein
MSIQYTDPIMDMVPPWPQGVPDADLPMSDPGAAGNGTASGTATNGSPVGGGGSSDGLSQMIPLLIMSRMLLHN